MRETNVRSSAHHPAGLPPKAAKPDGGPGQGGPAEAGPKGDREGHSRGSLALSLCENHPENSRSRGCTSVEMDPHLQDGLQSFTSLSYHCRVWGSRGTLHPGTPGPLPESSDLLKEGKCVFKNRFEGIRLGALLPPLCFPGVSLRGWEIAPAKNKQTSHSTEIATPTSSTP